jgi:hypothetical protein
MHLLIRVSLAAVLIGGAAACGSSSSPTPAAIDLSGTWTGTIGAASGGGNALRTTWTIAQAGAMVSGPATVSTSPAVSNVAFRGTLAATLAGSQLTLALAPTPADIQGAPGCTVSGSGSASVDGRTMSGTLTVTFTSCEPLGLQPPASSQLTLTKQ